MEQTPLIYRIVLIGNSGVGKTCLLLRFADDDQFNSTYVSTIGVDFRFRTVNIDGKKVKLQIWDTAGQEKFRAITSAYYKGAQGIIFVYDITNRTSFEDVESWVSDVIKDRKQSDGIFCLVGAKTDLHNERQVSSEEGQRYAEDNKMFFMETSAKTNTNIETLFLSMGKELLSKLHPSSASIPMIPITKRKEEDKKSCCS